MEVGKTTGTLSSEDERPEEEHSVEEITRKEGGSKENRGEEDCSEESLGYAHQSGAQDPGELVSRVLSAWIAASPATIALRERIPAIAASESAVLIRGECGVGKDLLAELLHYAGPYRHEPLLKFNCASVPAELFDPAVLGCREAPVPKCRTVVLDEVAALSMPTQARLMHALERTGFQRARLIALTCVDLERAVARHSFREDLYFCLNVTSLQVPPLRERPEDIRPLAEHFLCQLAEVHRRPRAGFSTAALAALESYSYPGNVRELRSLVEHAVLNGTTPEVLLEQLPPHLREPEPGPDSAAISLDEMERRHIAEVLDFTRGKKTRAADILGISRKTLLEKRKRYGLG